MPQCPLIHSDLEDVRLSSHEVLCFYPFPERRVVPFQAILKVRNWVLRILHKETATAGYPCISHPFLGFLMESQGLQPQGCVPIRLIFCAAACSQFGTEDLL